jgi:hypothetical protein
MSSVTRRALGLLGAVGIVAGGAAAPALASVSMPRQVVILAPPTPSDSRAGFFIGNAVTCGDVGFPRSINMGSPSNGDASDADVSGTVKTNAGTTQPGVGQELDVTIIGANVVVDAVVVKGGDAYNVYSDPAVLPPALPPDQHYISPLNGGATVPAISHWFVCYHLTTPPPVGSLTVLKDVIPPDGIPATPLPTTYTALVNCNDGIPAHQNVMVTFGAGGGLASTSTLTGIPVGTVCTVVEQSSATFPPGSAVVYDPVGADAPGVTIGGEAGVTVSIINDFSNTPVATATVRLVKVVVAAPDIELPATYTVTALCDDGTTADVTLPGTGGDGTPVVTVTAGALCTLGENTSPLPPGWVVSYAVDGGPATAEPPIFVVPVNATVAVTITNDPSAVSPTSPTPPTDPDSSVASTLPDVLPPTGSDTSAPLIAGLVLVVVGGFAIGYRRFTS